MLARAATTRSSLRQRPLQDIRHDVAPIEPASLSPAETGWTAQRSERPLPASVRRPPAPSQPTVLRPSRRPPCHWPSCRRAPSRPPACPPTPLRRRLGLRLPCAVARRLPLYPPPPAWLSLLRAWRPRRPWLR